MRVQEVLMLPERSATGTEDVVTSDAVPLSLGSELTPNAKGKMGTLYERVGVLINSSDLSSIEDDLSPEESVQMLFLMMDWGDSAYALPLSIMDCIKKLEMAHQHSKNKAKDWKLLFLESLAVVGRMDVLHILGFDEEEIGMFKKALHLSPTKVVINEICGKLLQEEVTKLVKYISSKYLRNDTNTAPDGYNSKHLLELHILHWMDRGVMNSSNLTTLAEALRYVARHDLAGTIQYPNKCGVCVIFNQEHFSCDNVACHLLRGTPRNHSRSFREGSSKDADSLAQQFTKFGCLTQIFANCKAQEIDDHLENLAQAEDLATFDYLVVCFLSHGGTRSGKQFIYSSDCKELLVEEQLVRRFEAGHCRALDGKLKLVITQACMGTDNLPVVPVVADGPSSLLVSAQRDFLFCQAATPGFMAYRIPSQGSLYICALCQVLSDLGEHEQLVDCFQEVHNRLSSQFVTVDLGDGEVIVCAVQPQMIVRTRLKFFFAKSNE